MARNSTASLSGSSLCSAHTLKELKELRKRIDKAIAVLEHHPAADKPRRHKRSTRKRISQTMQQRWRERKALRRAVGSHHEGLGDTTHVGGSSDNNHGDLQQT